LRGWKIKLVLDATTSALEESSSANSTTTNSEDEGVGILLLGQLSCIGGEICGPAFAWPDDNASSDEATTLFEEATSLKAWHSRYYESILARNRSRVGLSNDKLALNYI